MGIADVAWLLVYKAVPFPLLSVCQKKSVSHAKTTKKPIRLAHYSQAMNLLSDLAVCIIVRFLVLISDTRAVVYGNFFV